MLIFVVLGREYFKCSEFMMWLDLAAVTSSFVTEMILVTTKNELPVSETQTERSDGVQP